MAVFLAKTRSRPRARELGIDRYACAIGAHGHAVRLRLDERAYDDAYRSETTGAAGSVIAGVAPNVTRTGVAVHRS
jgi:hypothetical protein